VSAARRNRAFFQNLSEGGQIAQTLPSASPTSPSIGCKESASVSDSSGSIISEDESDQERHSSSAGRRPSPPWTDEESQSDDQTPEGDVDLEKYQDPKSSYKRKIVVKGECNRADHVTKARKGLDKTTKQGRKGKGNQM
jgi:hypothetical protein